MTAPTTEANGPEPTLDEELLLWLGDQTLAADAERIRHIASEFERGFAGWRESDPRSACSARPARPKPILTTG
jgi:hypothetical protein